jgi:hypothetical protein
MTIVEDALALARTGRFKDVSSIKKALARDGHAFEWVDQHLSGKQIRSELIKACRDAQQSRSK